MDKIKKILVVPILEIGLGLITIWWAIVLCLSPNLFEKLPMTYAALDSFSNPIHWGLLFLLIGIFNISGLLFSKPKLRKIGLFGTATMFALVSAGLFLSSISLNTGAGVYGVLSFMALWEAREDNGNHGGQ